MLQMTAATRAAVDRRDGLSPLSPWWFLLVAVAAVAPFLLVATPPIMDFANHAARLDLACAMGDPAVSAMYRMRWGVIPNLAADLVNAPLCGLVDPSLVLRICTAGALLAIFGCLWRLQRHLFGRANPVLLLAPAMAMNLVTTGGYINYLMGAALAVALVTALVTGTRSFGRAVLLANLAGVAIFLSHIFALMLAVLAVWGWRMNGRPLRPGTAVRAGLEAAAMFALPLVLIPLVAQDPGATTLDWDNKARLLIAPFMANAFPYDMAAMAAILVAYLLLRRAGVTVAPAMRRPLAMVAAFVVLGPCSLRDAVDVDARTLIPLAWLFVASLGFTEPRARPLWSVALIAGSVLGYHSTLGAVQWPAFARQVAEVRAAFAVLPVHARVLTLSHGEEPDSGVGQPVGPHVYSHLASYATRDRRVFNPLEFTGVGMQPLSSVAPYAAIDVGAFLPLPPKVALALATPTPRVRRLAFENRCDFALNWPDRFDYVIYYRFGTGPELTWPWLRAVRRGSFFTIYRIRR